MASEDFCPIFLQAPVVETIIGVQFAPLRGFKTAHFGWFWRSFLAADGWVTVDDEKPIPTYREPFDDLKLKMTAAGLAPLNLPEVRMKVRNTKRSRSVQFQADKIYFTWNREDAKAPRYAAAKVEFVGLFEQLQKFALEAGLGPIEPNLWDVTYVNQIPSGNLWQEPKDWHRVLPSLFPSSDPGAEGLPFRTYDGTWHFEIEPKRGRVHLNVAKMIRDGSTAPVMYVRLSARGEIGAAGANDWSEGLDIGHAACIRLFHDAASPEARQEWGLRI